MAPVLLKKSQHRIVSWKNGLGKTAEIAIFPGNADFTASSFLWRLSSATFSGSAPFSSFAGYDRLLTVLSDDRLKLNISGRDVVVKQGEVTKFSGHEQVVGEAPASGITDLNLILKRGAASGEMQAVKVTTTKPKSFELEARTGFIIGLSGSTLVSLYPGEEKFKLEPGDALRIDFDEASETDESARPVILVESPKEKTASVVVVELTWRA